MERLSLWKNDLISRSSNQSIYNWEAHALISSSSPKWHDAFLLSQNETTSFGAKGASVLTFLENATLSVHNHSAMCVLSTRIGSDLSWFSELPTGATECWVRRRGMMNSCGLMSKLVGCSCWPQSHTDAFSLLGQLWHPQGHMTLRELPTTDGKGSGSVFWRQGCICAGKQVKS